MTGSHIAHEAAHRIDVGEPHPQQPHDCTAVMTQLLDAAVRCGLAFTNAALGACVSNQCDCRSADSSSATDSASKRIVRRPVRFPRTDKQRLVTLETPLSTGVVFVPPERVSLLPPNGRDDQKRPIAALAPGDEVIQIEVDATGLPGAVYRGTLRVRAADGSSDVSTQVHVEL